MATPRIGDGATLGCLTDVTTVGTVAFDYTTTTSSDSVGEIQTITPTLTGETVDVTALSSGGRRAFLVGLRSATCSFDSSWDGDDSVHQIVRSGWDTGVKLRFEIVFPDGNRWEFIAIVTNMAFAIPTGDHHNVSVDLQIDGAITETTA